MHASPLTPLLATMLLANPCAAWAQTAQLEPTGPTADQPIPAPSPARAEAPVRPPAQTAPAAAAPVLPAPQEPPAEPPPPQAEAAKDSGGFVLGTALGVAVLSSRAEFARAFNLGIYGGYRWKHWGLLGSLDYDRWRSPRVDGTGDDTMGTVNIGIGTDYRFADDLVRVALAAGVSVLVIDTYKHSGGTTTGFFFDIKPMGLRWNVATRTTLGIDPLGFRLMVPDTGSIPLVEVQFVTSIFAEWDLT